MALPGGHVDWEVEVVAVIGRGGYRIAREDAWDHVAGLTLGQDLSERVLQLTGKPPQFSLAKSHPGFGPTGPVVVPPDELPNRNDLGFACGIGEEVLQEGRTSQLIFPVDDLVARLSAVCPLLPGDLIFTGTPEGVGNRRIPPRFLVPGETLAASSRSASCARPSPAEDRNVTGPTTMRTEVAVVGGGPAGLMPSHLLHVAGIESVVLDTRTVESIESTHRAGILERDSVGRSLTPACLAGYSPRVTSSGHRPAVRW